MVQAETEKLLVWEIVTFYGFQHVMHIDFRTLL